MVQPHARHDRRTPDFINRAITGYGTGAAHLGRENPQFCRNVFAYYEYLRENDLYLTHTLISPQSNRSVGFSEQVDPFLVARVAKERDAGIVIRGYYRMLATLPFSDEIMGISFDHPERLLRGCAACVRLLHSHVHPGLKFMFRETVDYGRSHFDHPLGSRLEEMDAVVAFDNVFVPWKRVFLYRDIEICNQAFARTGAIVHMAHQVVVKNVSKCELMLGLASLLASTIAVESLQHIKENLPRSG